MSIRLRSASYKPGQIPDRTKRSETTATDPRSPRSTCTSPPYCQIRSCSAFSRLLESSYKNFAASCWFAFQLVRAAAVTRPSEPMMRGLSYLTGSLSTAEHDILHEAVWPWRKSCTQCIVLEIDPLLSHPPLFPFSSSSARANRETRIDSAGTLLELFPT